MGAVGLLWVSAVPSLAATPIDGSPYVSDPYERVTGEPAAAKLVVSRDGERLVPRRGAFVSVHSPSAGSAAAAKEGPTWC